MKKLLLPLLILLLIAPGLLPVTRADSPSFQLVLLHTNDTHGHPLKFYDYPAPDEGGLPARATYVRQIREENPNVLLLDAGDMNTGRPESVFFKAEPDIIGFNYIGYDAMAMGNHEFDNSMSVLEKQMALAKFPFLAANVTTKSGAFVGKPYIIKEFKGFKVAILGLTTKEAGNVGNPENVKDLVFADEVETARRFVPELKRQADIVIALVHMGIFNDNSMGSRRLAQNVPGIDLIVDGHSHTKLTEPLVVNGVPIVQAGQWGLYVGQGVLTIQNRKIADLKWNLVPINIKTATKKPDGGMDYHFVGPEIKEDPALLALLKPYADQVDKVLSEVIGTADERFPNQNSRSQETAIGDLVCDAMHWQTKSLGVDFAINNGGGIRADLPQGPIAKRTVYESLPFDNSVIVLSLKGSDVLALFDYIATIAQGLGAFPQVSAGVSFTINYTTGKCENILINGKPVDPDRIYKIATNSYMAGGGDGYKILTRALDRFDTSAFQRDVLIDYIIGIGGTVKPVTYSRITVIGEKLAYFQPAMPKLIA